MNFSDILKAISHASWTDVLLLGFTLSVTVIGACIALGVGVPLALRFLQQQRQKYSRRRAGRRRAQPIAERGWGYGKDSIQNRAPTRPHPALRSRPWVAALATFVVAVVCTLATVAGYAIADHTGGDFKAAINGFAAGALLVMLIDSMIPEAARKAGDVAGLVTVLGFAVAIAL